MELICAECKNKWMPSNRINEVICPYCGNIIGELSRDFSSFEDGIAYIRNMFGDDIFEQRRFFFICTEYCLDYYEKEISAFKILYDSGLSKRILNLRGSDEKIIVRSKKQFVYQLRMKNGMNTSWAEYVIDLFCFATGISTENEFSSNILSKVRKAENGDPEAQYQVGICYKDGKGVERSLDDAIKWLSLSAGQKYTEAMVALYHIYFNLLATCPHTTLFDKIDDLVGKNQISDSDGQEIKSKLMIGQSESVKIESYFYTLQTQIQPFLYRTKSREKPVNVRKNISNKELLVINIGNIANELYVNVLIEELKRAIAYGSSAAVVLDSISIVGNDKLKELIMGLSGQVRFTVIGDDVVALSGSDEQLFTTLVGRAKKIVVLSHNAGTSAVKWSQVFGEHDKQEQSYSVSKGGSYNSPIPFMASPNYNKQVNYNWKREYIVKPEKIMNLGYGEAFVYSGDINELAHVTFR